MLLFNALCPSQTCGKEEGRGNRLGVGSQSQASPRAERQPTTWAAWMAGLWLLLSQRIGNRKQTSPRNRASLHGSELPPRGTEKQAADLSAGRGLCEAWAQRAPRAGWLFVRTFRDPETTARKSVGAITPPEGEKTTEKETSRGKSEHLVPEHSA